MALRPVHQPAIQAMRTLPSGINVDNHRNVYFEVSIRPDQDAHPSREVVAWYPRARAQSPMIHRVSGSIPALRGRSLDAVDTPGQGHNRLRSEAVDASVIGVELES
jgi:hypothetical protein